MFLTRILDHLTNAAEVEVFAAPDIEQFLVHNLHSLRAEVDPNSRTPFSAAVQRLKIGQQLLKRPAPLLLRKPQMIGIFRRKPFPAILRRLRNQSPLFQYVEHVVDRRMFEPGRFRNLDGARAAELQQCEVDFRLPSIQTECFELIDDIHSASPHMS